MPRLAGAIPAIRATRPAHAIASLVTLCAHTAVRPHAALRVSPGGCERRDEAGPSGGPASNLRRGLPAELCSELLGPELDQVAAGRRLVAVVCERQPVDGALGGRARHARG